MADCRIALVYFSATYVTQTYAGVIREALLDQEGVLVVSSNRPDVGCRICFKSHSTLVHRDAQRAL